MKKNQLVLAAATAVASIFTLGASSDDPDGLLSALTESCRDPARITTPACQFLSAALVADLSGGATPRAGASSSSGGGSTRGVGAPASTLPGPAYINNQAEMYFYLESIFCRPVFRDGDTAGTSYPEPIESVGNIYSSPYWGIPYTIVPESIGNDQFVCVIKPGASVGEHFVKADRYGRVKWDKKHPINRANDNAARLLDESGGVVEIPQQSKVVSSSGNIVLATWYEVPVVIPDIPDPWGKPAKVTLMFDWVKYKPTTPDQRGQFRPAVPYRESGTTARTVGVPENVTASCCHGGGGAKPKLCTSRFTDALRDAKAGGNKFCE